MTAGVDNPGGLGYHTNRKGAAASGWPGHWIKLSKSRQPSPCGVAVVLFDTYGHDKAAPVKRNSKRHIHTPFRRPQPTAYALCSAQRLSAGTRISHFPTDCKRPVRRMGEGYQRTTVTVRGGGCLFAREPARGVSVPTGDLYLFPRRKRYQKGAQGARPLENPQFVVYLPSAVPGLILPAVPALRLPLPIVYPRVLTEAPAVAHRCGADLHGSDSEGPRC